MKLPCIASNGVDVTTSTKSVFATNRATKSANKISPTVNLSLNNTKTRKTNSTHLAPIATTKSNTSIKNENENNIINNNYNSNKINEATMITSLSSSLSIPKPIQAGHYKLEQIENAVEKATAATTTTSIS